MRAHRNGARISGGPALSFVLRQVSRDADVSRVPPFHGWSACPTLPVVLWLAGCGFRFRQVAMNLPDADVRVGWDKRTIERTGKQPRTSFFQRPADLRETERRPTRILRSICEPAHPISPPFLCDARSSKWSPLSGGPALTFVLRQVSRDADVSRVPPFQRWPACPTLPVVLWLAGCGFRFRQVAMNLPDADVRVGWDKRTIERTGKQPRTPFFQRPADLRETERRPTRIRVLHLRNRAFQLAAVSVRCALIEMEPAFWWAGASFVLRQVSRDADVSRVPPFHGWSACPTLPWLAGCGFRFRQVAMNLPDAIAKATASHG